MSPPTAMTVVVNGEELHLPSSVSVADLVARLGAGPTGIAVARNEDVVPRSTWPETPVRDGDRIEILDAAQGG